MLIKLIKKEIRNSYREVYEDKELNGSSKLQKIRFFEVAENLIFGNTKISRSELNRINKKNPNWMSENKNNFTASFISKKVLKSRNIKINDK